MTVPKSLPARTLALALLLAAGSAWAATPINQQRPLNATGQVSIDNIKGRIVVRTWAQPQVKITGSLGKGVEKLLVEGDAQSLRIQVKYPKNGDGWFGGWLGGSNTSEPTTLEVTLPQQAAVEVNAVSADVDVQGVAGRRLSVDSVSGDVLVSASRPQEAVFNSVSGDLGLALDSNSVSTDSVSGDTRLEGRIGGKVSLESVSGNVSFSGGVVDRLSFSTVSGDGQLRLALSPTASVKADAVSGTLRLSLPAATSARLHAETFSGDLHAPVGQVEEEDHGPGKSLDARLGTGQADIKLDSFSGDITITTF